MVWVLIAVLKGRLVLTLKETMNARVSMVIKDDIAKKVSLCVVLLGNYHPEGVKV